MAPFSDGRDVAYSCELDTRKSALQALLKSCVVQTTLKCHCDTAASECDVIFTADRDETPGENESKPHRMLPKATDTELDTSMETKGLYVHVICM